MQKGSQILSEKTRRLYATDDPTLLVREFTDDAPRGEGVIRSKGACNNRISAKLFETLERDDVPTYFVKALGEREMLARNLDLFPLDVIVRDVAAGDFAKRLGLPEGEILPFALVEFHLKSARSSAGLRYITDITEGHVKIIQVIALHANHTLRRFLDARGLTLADARFEFGLDTSGHVRIGNEITPDTCRMWDKATHEKLDRDRFRRDLGGAEQDYMEVLKRVAGAAGGASS